MNIMSKINNEGQVLLIVTIALATLLGVGLSVSNQTLSSITRTSQTDSFQKVTAAAEGGLEKYLLLTDSVLETKIGANNLIETFDASNTKAIITIEDITTGNEGLTFPEISINQVGSFYFSNNLETQSFSGQKTCLKITTSSANPDFMLNVIVKNPSVQNFSPTSALNATYDATSSNQYLMEKYIYKDGSFASGVSPESCGTNSYRFTNAAMLRITPLKNSLTNVKIEIINSDISNLSSVRQGYKIVSVGEFSSGDDKTTRRITASKYLDAPSYVFDFTAFIDN